MPATDCLTTRMGRSGPGRRRPVARGVGAACAAVVSFALVCYLSLATLPVTLTWVAYHGTGLARILTFGQFTGFGHVVMYGGLSVLALVLLRSWIWRAASLCGIAAAGLGLELLQGLGGHRHFETADLWANAIGVGLALALWSMAQWRSSFRPIAAT